MRYMVVIERGESSWGAHVPDLPGCIAVGETRDEVIALIRDAAALHVDGLRQAGLPVPKPSSEGGFVEVAESFEQHVAQLGELLELPATERRARRQAVTRRAFEFVRPLGADQRHGGVLGREAPRHVQRLPWRGLLIFAHAERELAGPAEQRHVRRTGPAAADVDHAQPQRPPDRGVG
ncbi:MAG: type II toxin-antitoxin system HicB family antitoxin, partial [Candidatus Eisenbacteria bacterium]